MSFEGTLPSAADHTQSRRIHGSDDVTEPPWDLEVVDDDPSSIGKPWLSEANASRSPTAVESPPGVRAPAPVGASGAAQRRELARAHYQRPCKIRPLF